MNTKFKIIVETGQGRAVYPAEGLSEAVAIYREQLDTYSDSQIHLLRDMPQASPDNSARPQARKIEKHRQIDSRFLKQQTEGADPGNPLYGKTVVMSGTFEQIDMGREEVAEAIQKLGAKLNRSVSGTIQVFVQGDRAGSSKVREVQALRASGRDVRIVTPVELKEIIDGYLPEL